MSSFTVLTPTLEKASVMIDRTTGHVSSAGAAVSPGQAAAFGSEPIGAAFGAMCGRVQQVTGEIEQTVGQLSTNVMMASIGYLQTDQGILSLAMLHEFGGIKP